MTLGVIYRDIRKILRAQGIESADIDARLLMSFALGCAPQDVILKPETPASMNAALENALQRRLAFEPVAKIVGFKQFYGLEFIVNREVLDPRADTETLIDEARRYMRPDARVLDLCTGSGCVLATLLTLYPHACGVASDVSTQALDVARRNFERLGVGNRTEIVQGAWLGNVTGTFDLIVCNPPYIESGTIPNLAPDVRLHDPHLALDGGADGLSPYRIVFPQIRARLNGGGAALFEMGASQGADITRLAESAGLQVIGITKDLGGNPRVVTLR